MTRETWINVASWALVGTAAALGIYACVLFSSISPALAHGLVGLFH